MNIGYSFWGFLGDYKFDKYGNEVSTPDGNAFYSWSIIKKFQDYGHKVVSLMPDRDEPGYKKLGDKLFEAFCTEERAKAYRDMVKTEYKSLNEFKIIETLKEVLSGIDLILLEWRFLIPGRNDGMVPQQPDYLIQHYILKIAKMQEIPVIVFDLDYKLTVDDIVKYGINCIVELGDKWDGKFCKRVEIPFDFDSIHWFSVNENCNSRLVYVGNRYERDQSVNKYIKGIKGAIVYGNWNEGGRESSKQWPNIEFRNRITQKEMRDAYSNGDATILLAKDGYYKKGFMTARLIESIFYGVVPFFPEEFGDEVIKKYAGKFARFLKVSSSDDIMVKLQVLSGYGNKLEIISYLRSHLRFMDAKNFVDNVLDIYDGYMGWLNEQW